MTPPDSGDKPLCIVCWLPATRGLPEDGGKLYWCDKHGPFYDKPDSGEREVPGLIGELCNVECVVKGEVAVHVPLPLAQRILAALEFSQKAWASSDRYAALASELRAAVERKP